jgi:hypothetical protein
MTAPDAIKAGKYELVALSWDEPTSKPGEPFAYKRHVRGDVITLDVEQARRLVLAGAVVKPGEREKARIAQLQAQLQAQLAALPPEVREQLKADAEPAKSEPPTPPGTPAAASYGPPARNGSRDDWAAYALTLGATEADLEGQTRDYIRDLVDLHVASKS